jgi:hypothetical protein
MAGQTVKPSSTYNIVRMIPLKKYIFLLGLLMIFHALPAPCASFSKFAVADSLYGEKLYVQAIKEYSRFLDSVDADYAFYKIGLCKNEIAGFCVSKDQFDRFPEMYRKKYGDKYQTYIDYINYITGHPNEFWYFDPAAFYVSRGIDFQKIISDYPKSAYVDDSAYELLLQSRHSDWEGNYSEMLPRIDRCKVFLESYPDSNVRDKVVDLCVDDYNNIINNSWKLPDSLKTEYEKELKEFKQQWGR